MTTQTEAMQKALEAREREAFEAWATAPEHCMPVEIDPEFPRTYKDYTTAWAWAAFRAGRAALRAEQEKKAEGDEEEEQVA